MYGRNILNEEQGNATSLIGYEIQTNPPPNNDQVLKYQSATNKLIWAADSTSSDATSIQNKNINNSPSDNQVLVYKSIGDQILWENQNAGDANKILGIPINITGLVTGQLLRYNGNDVEWQNEFESTDAEFIRGIPVTTNLPTNGQVLKYNLGTNELIYSDEGENAVSLRGIPISTTAPLNNQFLKYNSTSGELEYSNDITTASNVGAGTGIFKQKNINDLEFKSLINSTNINITNTVDEVSVNLNNNITINELKTFFIDGNGGFVQPLTPGTTIFRNYAGFVADLIGCTNLQSNQIPAAPINVIAELKHTIFEKVIRFNSDGPSSPTTQDNFHFDYTLNNLTLRVGDQDASVSKTYSISSKLGLSNYNNIFQIRNDTAMFMTHIIPQWFDNNADFVLTINSANGQLYAGEKSFFLTRVQIGAVSGLQNNDFLRYDTTISGGRWINEQQKFASYYHYQSDGNAANNNFFRPGSGMNSDFNKCFVGLPAVSPGLFNIYTVDNISMTTNGTPGLGNFSTLTLYKNAIPTAVVLTLTDNNTYVQSTNSITAVPGDRLALLYEKNTADDMRISVTMRVHLPRI